MNNDIVMREEDIDNISSNLSNSSVKISNTGGSINSNFRGAINAGLLGNSAYKVSSQMNSISESIGNVQKIIREHSDKMFEYDKLIASKINDIEIPQDFITDDAFEINNYTQTLLSKIDGQSVNEGQDISKTSELDDIQGDKASLGNITKNDDVTIQDYDDSSDIKKQYEMGSVVSNANLDNIKYDDSSEIQTSSVLKEMDGSELSNISEYDDSSRIKNYSIYDMNNNQTEIQNYDDSSNVKNVELSNINN